VSARETALRAASAAIAKQGIDPVLLDVSRASGYTDFILIVSGRSDRHVDALADAVQKELSLAGFRPLGLEGSGGRWMLLDYGDLVVHVFYPVVRGFYDLEALWVEAPRIQLETQPASADAAEVY